VTPGLVERIVLVELARVMPRLPPEAMERALDPFNAAAARLGAASVQLAREMDALFAELAAARGR